MNDREAHDPTPIINELLRRLSEVRRKRKELEKQEQQIVDDLIVARRELSLWRQDENIEGPLEPLPGSVFDQNRHRPTAKRRPENPTRGVVVDAVCKIIAAAGRPLGITELYDQLLARDIEIQGRNPEAVLTTILWRSRDRLMRFDKTGYWPADLPIASPGAVSPTLGNADDDIASKPINKLGEGAGK